jgi:hypothetical protein
MMGQSAVHAFAKNRAEELGFDLTDLFVMPLFFDKLALHEVRKPLLIEGGRGCGKTTLLRYLSHQTQLSPKRQISQDNLPKEIGLYLRADTQYLRAFAGDALDDREWQRAFEHSLCLSILGELLGALTLLDQGQQRKEAFAGIESLDLGVIRDFDEAAPDTLRAMQQHVYQQKNRMASWLNNPDDEQRPRFLPLKQVLIAAIDAVRQQLPFLAEQVFFVFIDEYENLLQYQMQVINTLLKHSEPPLIFHVATKRNGMATRATIGTEQLQEPADYRKFDVEEHLARDFELFASELFCFRLGKRGTGSAEAQFAVSAEVLMDPTKIGLRRDDADYRRRVRAVVDQLLPGMSMDELARFVLKDESLHGRLLKVLSDGLAAQRSGVSAGAFVRAGIPTASVCSAALLHQGKKAEEVLEALDKQERGEKSRFGGDGGWIHHYLVGCILHLYLPLQRPCLLYAGFDAFLKLSRGNVRHFLELCHLSMVELDHDPKPNESVPVEKQAMAARTASALFVKESQGSGDEGNRLFLVVNTLGQIFRLSQNRPSQSEAERTHFSIDSALPPEADAVLQECVKWSILFVVRETKVKDERYEGEEYILNPIYAPYFGISYNKGRKLNLSAQAAIDLLVGSRDNLDKLLKNYKSKWLVSEDQLPLI